MPLTRHNTWQTAALIALATVTWGCGQGNFQTPRPNINNRGVNSIFTDTSPSLSANGRFIAFSSSRNGSNDVYLFDREIDRLVELPGLNDDIYSATEPDVSGDGRLIVYVSSELGKSEVFLYDRETQIRENISNRRPGDVRNPTISPDGRYIAFESNSQGQWDIEIFDRGVVPPPNQQN